MDSPEKRWQNWFRIFGQELFNRWIATAPKNGHLTSTVTIDHANHVSVSLTGHGTEPDKDFKGSIQHAITEASWATPMPSRTTGPSFKSIKFEIIFSASDESFPDVITRGPGYAVWYDKDGTLHQSKGKHTPEITSDVEIIDSPSIPAQELFNAIQKTGI